MSGLQKAERISNYDPQTVVRVEKKYIQAINTDLERTHSSIPNENKNYRVDHFKSAYKNILHCKVNLQNAVSMDIAEQFPKSFTEKYSPLFYLAEAVQFIATPLLLVKNLSDAALHTVAGVADYIVNGPLPGLTNWDTDYVGKQSWELMNDENFKHVYEEQLNEKWEKTEVDALLWDCLE
jgi:hypothetical protein